MKTRTEKKTSANSGENGVSEKTAPNGDLSADFPVPEITPEDSTDAFDALRQILVSAEIEQIEDLQVKVGKLESDFAKSLKPEEISPILPQAIQQSSKENNQLREATLPLVEANIRISAKRNPALLAEALFPVIGPAIRRAITEALSQMVQSLTKTLDNSVSVQGFRWRMEAWQTGKPFGEIVLLHTLLYRVEQVFLIHRENGLLLRHVAGNPADIHATIDNSMRENAEMVSAMLTAIQDFAKDSFKTAFTDQLDTLEYGELSIWIEHAPKATLAIVIRGNAPLELREVMQETLEIISHEQRRALENFKGDAGTFALTQPHLENCLRFKLDDAAKTSNKRLYWLGAGLLLIALTVGFFLARDYWRWTNFLQNLKAEKGIVVTETERGWFSHSVSGLRDSLSKSPQDIMKANSYNDSAVKLNFGNYLALDEEFVLQRARTALNPPASVTLKFENGVLSASGSAPETWRKEAASTARFLAGVNRFETGEMFPDFEKLKADIEASRILFNCGTTDFTPNQDEKINTLRENLMKLREIADNSDKTFALEFIGNSDQTGSPAIRREISDKRAEKTRNFFFPDSKTAGKLKISAQGMVDQNEKPNCDARIKIQ